MTARDGTKDEMVALAEEFRPLTSPRRNVRNAMTKAGLTAYAMSGSGLWASRIPERSLLWCLVHANSTRRARHGMPNRTFDNFQRRLRGRFRAAAQAPATRDAGSLAVEPAGDALRETLRR